MIKKDEDNPKLIWKDYWSVSKIKDQENYSKAYKYQRQELINNYFTHAVTIIVILIILLYIIAYQQMTHQRSEKF